MVLSLVEWKELVLAGMKVVNLADLLDHGLDLE